MELNIFCINKKTKKKQQTTTETWTDDRARQPAADDRASDSNTGRGQQAGTLGQHNWALGGILLLLLLLLLLAARLLFQFSGDRLSLDLHLAINRLLSLDPSIDRSIYRAAQATTIRNVVVAVAVLHSHAKLLAG